MDPDDNTGAQFERDVDQLFDVEEDNQEEDQEEEDDDKEDG